ncbi:IscS subfamily cysteine desulfurase [Bacillus norwichensis]|uniref:IscS subfamily cysteine desulfurase n=1 Tax=Bacillus norwichensis TaxID=2762217 RepID=A0ABR8VHU0_9BACI|nr:IscS subfamily cysteine desulfurase [Bacillus norwichensis]MBD8004310.1 IscS subfamily cysteine desulfurase [Bacillus norwichensis]
MKYFDYAASCPLDQEAAEVYIKAASTYYGNSSSLHDIGDQANELLEYSRAQFARFFGVSKDGVFFTSGGSEGNFLSIQTLLTSKEKKGRHIITGMAEHSSVLNSLEKLRQAEWDITMLPLASDGRIDVDAFLDAVREDTVLVSIQHANPEIGTLHPIEEIGQMCRENGILFHSDCVQSFGKMDLSTIAHSVDALTISSHKFYGPKGVGAVYLNPALRWDPYVPGTTHEGGFRPGTVNVPGIAAMAAAAEKAVSRLDVFSEHYKVLRKEFIKSLDSILKKCTIYEADLPSTIGMRVAGLEGQLIMNEANLRGFAISTGSACQVSMQTPSKTMVALGVEGKAAKEFIRITLGRETEVEDVRQLGEALVQIVRENL